MKNSTGAQFHHHEHIKGTEAGRHDYEEVAGHDRFGVIVNEREPTLLWIGRAHGAAVAQVLLHGAGRNPDPQLQFQLVGEAFLSPGGILSGHLPDQFLEILGQPRPSHRSRPAAPEQTESLAMPSDERVRLHIHRRIAPLEHLAQGRHHPPGGIVGPSWPDLPLLEERQLFPEEEVLRRQYDTGSTEEEHKPAEVGQHLAKGTEEVSKAPEAAG